MRFFVGCDPCVRFTYLTFVRLNILALKTNNVKTVQWSPVKAFHPKDYCTAIPFGIYNVVQGKRINYFSFENGKS